MTAAERSELAEFRQEVSLRFDSVDQRLTSFDDRIRTAEIAKAVNEALLERQNVVDGRTADATLSNRALVGVAASILVSLILGLVSILINVL